MKKKSKLNNKHIMDAKTTILVSSDINISTCVYIANFNSGFDIENIFKNIQIDDNIIGIKYNDLYKGEASQTSVFYNQITVIVFLPEFNKKINIKLFSNGITQLTGVKNKQQALSSLKILLEKIKNINGSDATDIIIKNNIIYNNDNYCKFINKPHTRIDSIQIYGFTDSFVCVGERKGNDFSMIDKVSGIREKVYLFDDKYFLQTKHNDDHIKDVYNKQGVLIGYTKFIFKKKRKNIPIKSSVFKLDNVRDCEYAYDSDLPEDILTESYSIFDKRNYLIGKQFFFIDDKIESFENLSNINVDYKAIQDKKILSKIMDLSYYDDFEKNIELKCSNINNDFKIILDKTQKIDREILHKTLNSSYNIYSYYNPESKYLAVKATIYFDEDNNRLNIKNKKKLSETGYIPSFKSTIIVWSNGNICMSGCKNTPQIEVVKKEILKIFNENPEFIYSINNLENSSNDNDISVWDLM